MQLTKELLLISIMLGQTSGGRHVSQKMIQTLLFFSHYKKISARIF